MADTQTPKTAEELETRSDVRRATAEWSDCGLAVIVEDDTDIAPIRRGRHVVDIENYDSTPYMALKLEETNQ